MSVRLLTINIVVQVGCYGCTAAVECAHRCELGRMLPPRTTGVAVAEGVHVRAPSRVARHPCAEACVRRALGTSPGGWRGPFTRLWVA